MKGTIALLAALALPIALPATAFAGPKDDKAVEGKKPAKKPKSDKTKAGDKKADKHVEK